MYKISNYIVPVQIKEQEHQKTLLFSTRSSSLKLIDYSLWDTLNKKHFKKIPTTIIEELLKEYIIVKDDENELSSILIENKKNIESSTNLYMSIQPTAACPLGCGYCGQKHENKNMKTDIQEAVLKRLKDKLNKKSYKSLGITWFGAEPLVGFKVIKNLSPQIIEISKEYNIKYNAKIVTNGFLLEPQIAQDLLEKYNVNEYEITLDGTAFYHDQRRHTKAMGPSFDRIYQNIKQLACLEKAHIIIRCNVDHRNKDSVIPLLRQLHQDNLHKRIKFYVAPIHSWGNDAHLIAAEKGQFSSWEIDWLIEMEQLDYSVSYLPSRTKAVCFAVKPENELIDPFGGIYGCSEVSLVPSYLEKGENIHQLGHVMADTLSHGERRHTFGDFYDETKIKKFGCSSCRMLPTCGGGCPKEWVEGRIPCPSTKFNIEQRILLTYLKNKDKTIFKTL